MSSDPTPASSIDEKREPVAAPATDLEGGHLGRTDSEIEKDGGGEQILIVASELQLTHLPQQRSNSSAPTLLLLASRQPPME